MYNLKKLKRDLYDLSFKMNSFSILIFTFSICFDLSYGFFARTIRDGNGMTKTHLDITAAGTLRAIDKYIKSNKGSGSIDDFFSEGKIILSLSLVSKSIKFIHCSSIYYSMHRLNITARIKNYVVYTMISIMYTSFSLIFI